MFVPIFLLLQILFVQTMRYQKPVAERVWSTHCNQNEYVLNDCNWCSCGRNHHFQCKARVCEEVDMFGHFKDTIQEIDVGMEGHGTWRSRSMSCSPGVKYQRGTVHCICDGDGNWPNPVCRDLFRILHPVEVTEKAEESMSQTCLPTKLYLVTCNICFCPSSGKLDEKLCTNRTCSDGDPVLEPKDNNEEPQKVNMKTHDSDVKPEEVLTKPKDANVELINDHRISQDDHDNIINGDVEPSDFSHTGIIVNTDTEELEIYAPCNIQTTYTIGHQICKCLTNNRLICKDYNDDFSSGTRAQQYGASALPKSSCTGNIGLVIKKGCNLCKCTRRGYMYCTTRNCVPRKKGLRLVLQEVRKSKKVVKAPIDDLECIAGTTYKRGCNTCYCKIEKGRKIFSCTVKACSGEDEMTIMTRDCVLGTDYEIDCFICSCNLIDGEKYQVCGISPRCWTQLMPTQNQTESLDSLYGYCEPRREYKNGCNTCRCMSDGKIVRCTTHPCIGRSPEPIEVEIVPLRQAVSEICPNGHSYKVECNLCFCLSNGNALCTASDCSKQTILNN